MAVLSGCAGSRQCGLGDDLYDTVAKARGLDFKTTVPCRIENPAQMRGYLKEEIVRSTSSDRFQFEGTVYKLLGLIPPDFDYIHELIEIFSTQLEGYYDPERKELVLASSKQGSAAKSIAAHELIDALQDQHFGVRKLLDKTLTNDEMLVRSAILEGDATLMAAQVDRTTGDDAARTLCRQYTAQSVANEMQDIVNSNSAVPRAIRLFITYPYVYGPYYLCKFGWLEKQSGEESRRFWLFPRGTRELRLFAEGKLDRNILRNRNQKEYDDEPIAGEIAFSDTLGEFSLFALFATYLPFERAKGVFAYWSHDALWYFDSVNGEPGSLVWRIWCRDVEAAEQLFSLFREAYSLRFKQQPEFTNPKEVLFSPTSTGDITLKRDHNLVSLHVVNEIDRR